MFYTNGLRRGRGCMAATRNCMFRSRRRAPNCTPFRNAPSEVGAVVYRKAPVGVFARRRSLIAAAVDRGDGIYVLMRCYRRQAARRNDKRDFRSLAACRRQETPGRYRRPRNTVLSDHQRKRAGPRHAYKGWYPFGAVDGYLAASTLFLSLTAPCLERCKGDVSVTRNRERARREL